MCSIGCIFSATAVNEPCEESLRTLLAISAPVKLYKNGLWGRSGPRP